MDYKVTSYKGEKSDRLEIWRNYSLEDIRHQAREWIEQGEADSVRVRDSFGKLVIRYPDCGNRPDAN